jgi:acyl carrier protein phosphodiesterase
MNFNIYDVFFHHILSNVFDYYYCLRQGNFITRVQKQIRLAVSASLI